MSIRPPVVVHSRRRAGLLALLTLLGVLGGTVLATLPAVPAAAVTPGPGYTDADNGGVGGLGSIALGGRYVYCLQPGIPVPPGAPGPMTYRGWAGLSADDLARLNWAISTRGQSGVDADAAAVAMYVWSVAAPAAYNSHGMSGDAWYIGRVPSGERARVLGILADLRSRAASITATRGPSGAPALEIATDPVDHYAGTVTVRGVAADQATGVLRLDHGVFEATGSDTLTGAVGGASYAITGVPPAGAAPYRIAVTGEFVWTAGWRGELAVYETPGYQAIAGPGRDPAVTFSLTASDERDRTVAFLPVLSTVAAADEVGPGARFEDRIAFALQPGPDGVVNRWYRDPTTGVHLALNASCRVYGPFPAPPAQSALPPPTARFATSFIVTSGPDGPDIDYLAASEEPLEEPGWYTAWCSIDHGSQSAVAREFLPSGYRFADRFGVPAETIRLVLPPEELPATGIDDPRPMLVIGTGLGASGLLLLSWRLLRAGRQC